MPISDRNKTPDNFETKLQPDPMWRTGRANGAWVWAVVGAIVMILIVTFVALIGRN